MKKLIKQLNSTMFAYSHNVYSYYNRRRNWKNSLLRAREHCNW